AWEATWTSESRRRQTDITERPGRNPRPFFGSRAMLSSRAQRGTFKAAEKAPRCARDDSGCVLPLCPMSAHPISVKGVLIHQHRVLLLLNERGEWDLPGGRPDPGEDHRAALEREVREETGLSVE